MAEEQKPYTPLVRPQQHPLPVQQLSDEELEKRSQKGWNPEVADEIQRRQLKNLGGAVDRLKHPRWIDWAIFIVGAIAAIAAMTSLILKR